MATQKSTIEFLLEQCANAGDVAARKMFGEYGLYCDGKVVALVCDDQVFLKPTDEGKDFLRDVEEGIPFPGAKPWLLISGERWEDHEWLTQLIRITAVALPLPIPKKVKKKHAD